MNQFDYSFEENTLEALLTALPAEGKLSAVSFLAAAEDLSEEELEEAFALLEGRQIMLDVTDLPKPVLTGASAARLQLEQKLVLEDKLPEGLDENDPLRLYLQELASIPACGDPAVLAMDAARGAEAARDMLVNVSLSRVIELAKSYTGRGVLLLDLIQEGSLGLWQSVLACSGDDFEVQRDWWIRFYLAKVIVIQARSCGVGQKMRQAMEDYRAVDERLLGELGRNPTLDEMADALHMSEEEAASIKKMLDNARLLEQAHEENEQKQEDPDDERHVEDTAYFQMRQRIMELLSGLDEQDVQLLTLRFGLEGGLPLSPEETGRKLGLTADEVVAREAAALAMLRNH